MPHSNLACAPGWEFYWFSPAGVSFSAGFPSPTSLADVGRTFLFAHAYSIASTTSTKRLSTLMSRDSSSSGCNISSALASPSRNCRP